MFVPDLRQIGLTDSEARVYIALLEAGDMVVPLLAQRIGLRPEEAYDILGGLRDKGVVIATTRGTGKYFNAVDPRELLSRLQEHVKAFEGMMPSLLSLKEDKAQSVGQVYEGVSEIQRFFKDILKERETVYIVSELDKLREYLAEEFFIHWNEERINNNIRLTVLTGWSDFKSDLLEIRLLENEKYSFPADFILCGEYLGILQHSVGGSLLLLYGKNIVRSFQSLFEAAWNTGRPEKSD